MINRLAIIGVGLIGGSLARAARRAGVCSEIVGGGRDEAQLRRAVELGVIDRYELDIAAAVGDADMVVVAVPLGAMEAVLRRIAGRVRPDAVITDVGSAKGSVVAAARAAFGEVPPGFVPGHPIAGTEKSGVEASFAELFESRRVILTPLSTTSAQALAAVRALWQQAGAEVVEMDVAHHDEVLAATSHLPHVLAYALVDTLVGMDASEEIFRFAAGGFRDFTRIASSDPAMWRDICIANRAALLAVLERFRAELSSLTAAIEAADGERIVSVFSRAKAARDRYMILNSETRNLKPGENE
ncbi:MAG: prephenate dehydrogenase/arogenate dehydrogenase family protein [Gammaproteobacteria bacterium]|nr:prephenate dehydrogenase/arogenate dehydrogenase family protein [Gammaproteobacteria bacterium]